jgi:hypothetical protein
MDAGTASQLIPGVRRTSRRDAMVLAALVLLTQAAAADPPSPDMAHELAVVCKQVLCREPREVRLKLPDGKAFSMTPPLAFPIVSGETITVLAGETVYVEARVEGTALTDLKAAKSASHPDRTLSFSIRQDPSLADGTHMILTVTSPFKGALKYRLGMMLPDSKRLQSTSTCPIGQSQSAYEHWPYPIFQVMATDFRIVEPDSNAGRSCE